MGFVCKSQHLNLFQNRLGKYILEVTLDKCYHEAFCKPIYCANLNKPDDLSFTFTSQRSTIFERTLGRWISHVADSIALQMNQYL